jgi:hypothetical protein
MTGCPAGTMGLIRQKLAGQEEVYNSFYTQSFSQEGIEPILLESLLLRGVLEFLERGVSEIGVGIVPQRTSEVLKQFVFSFFSHSNTSIKKKRGSQPPDWPPLVLCSIVP